MLSRVYVQRYLQLSAIIKKAKGHRQANASVQTKEPVETLLNEIRFVGK